MSNKKFNKKPQPVAKILNPIFNASSSIDCNNPVAISSSYATLISIPPTPIVEEHQQALQKVKDLKEKGQICDNIVSNIQSSNVASPVLKEQFYNDIDKYLRNNLSVQASITSDSVCGIKHKMQDDSTNNKNDNNNYNDDERSEQITPKRKNRKIGVKRKCY
ncbi:hypothetical protein C1646_763838 [Rhizophagus diaphanus]|nr:hypothetical protein C1646_763838 [Rhizophagus diaphanus] [Rhizophagus sp. MUCL 43196]